MNEAIHFISGKKIRKFSWQSNGLKLIFLIPHTLQSTWSLFQNSTIKLAQSSLWKYQDCRDHV